MKEHKNITNIPDIRLRTLASSIFENTKLNEKQIYAVPIDDSIVYYGFLTDIFEPKIFELEILEPEILLSTGELSKLSVEEQAKKLKEELTKRVKRAVEWDLEEQRKLSATPVIEETYLFGTYSDYISKYYGINEILAKKLLEDEQKQELKRIL